MKNIYVGNVPHSSEEAALKTYFEQFGEVASVRIIKDKFTGASRGFAFIEMPNDEEGTKAIDGTNGQDFEGRTLRVNEARPAEDRPRRDSNNRGPRRDGNGGGGFGGGGFGGNRGGGSRGGNRF